MVAPFNSLIAKFELVCVLTLENAFPERFHFKANRRSIDFLKSGTNDFQNSPEFKRLACLHLTISGKFKGFQYFNFEKDFLKNENLFQKTGARFSS